MNVRPWLVALVIFGAVVFGGFWWALTPDSSEAEFQHAQEALKSVKSWKFKQLAPEGAKFFQEGSWEVDCATGWHGVIHEVNSFDEQNPGDKTIELSRRGDTTYMRSSDSDWGYADREYIPGSDPSSTCALLPQGKAQHPFPDYASLLNKSVITSKGTKKVNGVKCREWLVQIVKIMQRQDLTLCLGTGDHLVYEISDASGPQFTFSDYNQPVDLGGPK